MDEVIIKNGGDLTPRLDNLDDLLGKKSVRATFKLRPEAIEMLSILAAQLGIKQKSLFDYLMEDEDELQVIAESLPVETMEKEQRVQKTFVVSQKSLNTLELVAKHSPGSRSELIERSIQRLLPVFLKERERQDKREKAFAMIEDHFKQANDLHGELKQLVGKDDSLFSLIKPLIVHYSKAFAEIKKLVDKGKRISELTIDAFVGGQPER